MNAVALPSSVAPPVASARRRSISIVIPCYDEEGRIGSTLDRIDAYLSTRDYDSEIIVVDDGSRDRTGDTVAARATRLPRVRLLQFPINHGKGFATRAGILASRSESVLFCDADLSTPIEELDRLWPWVDAGFSVVIGSRRSAPAEGRVMQPLHRRLVGRAFNVAISMLGVRGFEDTQCGFKLFRGDAARRIFGGLRTEGFAFDVEALLKARACAFRIAEVAVRWNDAEGSHVHPIRDGCRMLVEVLKIQGILV